MTVAAIVGASGITMAGLGTAASAVGGFAAANAPALIGAGASIGSSLLSGGGGGGTPGSQGMYDVVELPTYDFTEPRLRGMSDFVQDQFSQEGLGGGNLPPWLSSALWGGPVGGGIQAGSIGAGLQRELKNTYFGGGFNPGVMDESASLAAMTGAGSGVANRMGNKQLQNYAQQSQSIDEFLASEGMKGAQQTMSTAGYMGLGIPQGPPSQVVGPFGAYGPQAAPSMAGPLASAMSGLGQMAANYPWQQAPETGAPGGGVSYGPGLTTGNSNNQYSSMGTRAYIDAASSRALGVLPPGPPNGGSPAMSNVPPSQYINVPPGQYINPSMMSQFNQLPFIPGRA